MKRALCAAGPILLALAGTAAAQFPPGMLFPARPIFVPAFYSFGYPYVPVRPAVIIVTTRPLPPLAPVDEPRRRDELPINPDEVIVIRPRPGGMKDLPPPRQALAPPPMLPEPPPKIAAVAPGVRQAPPPEADKRAENARQQKLGREAFAAGEYGRAAERFEQALRVDPNQALSYFLLAQAQFAMGKYRDAVASIHAGMKLQPDWPAAKFDPRELYGDNAGDHALHLERLRQAVERSPQEPALLFLFGVQLWFNNRRDDAKSYFRKALPNVADPKPIERFLAET